MVVGLAFTNLLELEGAARAKIPKPAYDYIAGGAEDEVSLGRNRGAFERWALRPRALVDVSRRDTSAQVLGSTISMPILVAPTAFHCLVHPDGEVATAQGAAAAGTLMVVSTLATRTLEEVASAGSAPRWFQLYVYRDRRVTENLVQRAERSGYHALCLTVDAPVWGRRERDDRNAFTLPPGLGVRNLETAGIDRVPEGRLACSGLSAYWGELLDPSLTWKDVEWLRSLTSLPILVKGVMTAEDAQLAVDHGVAGIVVSNHGGRQLDGTLGTLDVLPEVVAAVGSRVEVYVDGGIRRGSDVLKALALGARAVMVGRPILYGLALGGAEGVAAVLQHLRMELEMAMALVGRPSVAGIDRTVVCRAEK
jgi:4-hydroxymandelate oxidase